MASRGLLIPDLEKSIKINIFYSAIQSFCLRESNACFPKQKHVAQVTVWQLKTQRSRRYVAPRLFRIPDRSYLITYVSIIRGQGRGERATLDIGPHRSILSSNETNYTRPWPAINTRRGILADPPVGIESSALNRFVPAHLVSNGRPRSVSPSAVSALCPLFGTFFARSPPKFPDEAP